MTGMFCPVRNVRKCGAMAYQNAASQAWQISNRFWVIQRAGYRAFVPRLKVDGFECGNPMALAVTG